MGWIFCTLVLSLWTGQQLKRKNTLCNLSIRNFPLRKFSKCSQHALPTLFTLSLSLFSLGQLSCSLSLSLSLSTKEFSTFSPLKQTQPLKKSTNSAPTYTKRQPSAPFLFISKKTIMLSFLHSLSPPSPPHPPSLSPSLKNHTRWLLTVKVLIFTRI